MFTIKHIDKRNTEHLIEAVTILYKDNFEQLLEFGKPFSGDQVKFKFSYTTGPLVDGGRLTKTIDSGTIYVMNSNGKTVAHYELGNGD